ncbi:MAG: family 16 glycoside hydrolase [Isosphaeraceae bacterium]
MRSTFPRPLTAGLMLLAVAAADRTGRAQTPDELRQTARFVAAFQNPDGGFAPNVGQASTLGSTSSAIRTLKYAGGSIPNVPGAIAYVRSCWDESGGFAPTPGGKPDANTTAVGLMAVAELKVADPERVAKALEFLDKNAKTFEEIRLAVAGYEAVGKKPEGILPAWLGIITQGRKPDGTWGEGASRAFATGSAGVALLRTGQELDHRAEIVKTLRDGQRPDGGWAKDDGPSDLATSYRIMRGFYMLHEKPDLDGVRKFVAKYRQSDGGYAPAPGKPADVGTTYFAAIILYWARQLDGLPALTETAGFTPLFNGRDLEGWEGDTSLWSAKDGMLVGKSPGIKQNQFLATKADYKDFVLQLSFRLIGGEGNSGVQFRSERIPGTEMKGYQADIGENYWGSLYDESRRNKVLVAASPKALEAVRKDGWNHYTIRAMGNSITLTLNGVTSVSYKEDDPAIAALGGKIAVQIHAGGPMEVQFKDILIQPLPTPAADDQATPGFHLRTSQGGRKYTVYLPRGYDGKKAFPVLLFPARLGRAGRPSPQVGLGPAINNRPGDFPFVAVFPQARETWAAGSADSEAAVAALDEVLKTYRCDTDRILLTGLSMGVGASWEMAAKYPGKFAAVAPICGPGASRTPACSASPARLELRGRQRPRRYGPEPAGHECGPQRGRRQAPDHRVSQRRPQQLGPRLRRSRKGFLTWLLDRGPQAPTLTRFRGDRPVRPASP